MGVRGNVNGRKLFKVNRVSKKISLYSYIAGALTAPREISLISIRGDTI